MRSLVSAEHSGGPDGSSTASSTPPHPRQARVRRSRGATSLSRFATARGHVLLRRFMRWGAFSAPDRGSARLGSMARCMLLVPPGGGGAPMQTQAARRLDEPTSGPGLEPETILPSQFFGRFQLDASLQPEKRLMLAVLEDAVGTFQKYVNVSSRQGRRLFSEAEEWFASPDADWPFGFVNVCQALGLDAEYLRAGLWRWRDRQPRRDEH